MKISIVIPNYNYGKYIKRAIDSVLLQDYLDKEVVVVDGGSTDETVEILKGYGNKIRWISEKDRGQWDAINKGLYMVHGEIFAYLNSDDWYELNIFNVVADAFKDNTVALVYGKCRLVSAKEEVINEPPHSLDRGLLLNYGNMTPQPSTFFRRRGLIDEGGIGNFKYMMEHDMNLKVLKHGDAKYVDRVFSNFAIHEGQKSSQENQKAIVGEMLLINKMHGGGFFSPLLFSYINTFYLPSRFSVFNRKIKNFLMHMWRN